MATPIKSAVVLWVLSPLLLWLTLYRPYGASSGRALQLPLQLAGYRGEENMLTAQHRALLGTDDAIYRVYVDDEERQYWVTCVYHEQNWKSVHPPHICLEGSNMTILEDDSLPLRVAGDRFEVGRVLAHADYAGRPYLSLFVFAASGLRTHRYAEFFRHHLPRALVRRATSGFLLRVETMVGADGVTGAETRCADLMSRLLPAAEALLESS